VDAPDRSPTLHRNARRVAEALRAAGSGAQVREVPQDTHTAEQAAAVLGVPIGAIVKSLVFHSGEEPLLVLVSGARRVDTALLAQRLGRRVRRADAEEVRAATGQPIGGVSPVGHPAPLRTWVDDGLAGFPVVWAAAGTPRAVFPTSYAELLQLTGGEPGPVAVSV
jgi:prolyl-tRNA editing enzyme YbaK/EbsC (Cys-tRNA(Pro) deacylase)